MPPSLHAVLGASSAHRWLICTPSARLCEKLTSRFGSESSPYAAEGTKAHALAEAGGALTPAALNGIYRQLVADYFGPDLVIDDEVESEWARIPHFYRPFYVYKYATSYSAAVAIEEKIRKEKDAAAKPYLEFLSMGVSADPLDELRHAGVDLATPEPVEQALQKFERILDEAEKLAETLA